MQKYNNFKVDMQGFQRLERIKNITSIVWELHVQLDNGHDEKKKEIYVF